MKEDLAGKHGENAMQMHAQKIHFLLVPEFSMIALSSALEPLRVANRFGGALYEWVLVAEQKGLVAASNGVAIQATHDISEVSDASHVIVCSSFNPKKYRSDALRSWLRMLDRKGAVLGAFDTGIYYLADAGLVGKEKLTLHWEQIPYFHEEYPHANISVELFEISDRRMYCAGGTACLDMMLHKIAKDHDEKLAIEISEQFLLSRIRHTTELQRLKVARRHNVYSKRLSVAIMLMETHIENLLSVDEVAASAHISTRQLERLFKTCLGDTPSNFYLKLRLKHAQGLLKETDMSITEISIATGFELISYFSRAYRNQFNKPPSSERKLKPPTKTKHKTPKPKSKSTS